MPIQEDFWPELIKAIRRDDCVLLLGPRAATYENKFIYDLLIEHLKSHLKLLNQPIDDLEYKLSSVIKRYKACLDPSQVYPNLNDVFAKFYKQFKPSRIPLYYDLAQLPFKYIINTTPDDLIKDGLEANGQSCLFFDFHFRFPGRNAQNNTQARDIEEKLTEGAALIYNLLGHYDQPDSLVLTDQDQLTFLENIIKQEFTSSSTNINYHFYRPPKKHWRKAYVFLGFDFNDWHMRMFLHLLRRDHPDLPQTLNLQDDECLNEESKLFFRDNFNVHFIEDDASSFFKMLSEKLRNEEPKPPSTQESIEIMVLHAPEDDEFLDALEPHLRSLNRQGRPVNVWHSGKITPGGIIKEEMLQQANLAHIVIPLFSPNFLAQIEDFEPFIKIALERHQERKAKLTALIMSPCLFRLYEPLAELKTIYPQPLGKEAISQKDDPDIAIFEFVRELDKIIDYML